ncbi:MAG TPA: OB-fold nucleic acid binding domain-containing protein [Candidatus Nanoarchaeia archaeon]|nr:OB-fold nucleic acid binding domain-containing protein [Candidatus Nanoarchaeia archaeon]
MVLRQVAHKVWLQQLWSSSFVDASADDAAFLLVGDAKISRVNVLASVVEVYVNVEKKFSSLMLDDGSSTMRVKVFGHDMRLFDVVKLGSLVNIIGRVRKFNDELFIAPDVVRVVDNPNWELLRRVELLSIMGKFDRALPLRDLYQEIKDPVVVEHPVVESLSVRQKVLSFIERVEEAAIADAIKEADTEVEGHAVVKDLLKEGEIYQSRPGYVRVV